MMPGKDAMSYLNQELQRRFGISAGRWGLIFDI